MQSVKETASNIAASAKSGMEKTKATAQEKMEKMTAHNPAQKEMATENKQHKKNQAELQKQEVQEHNAAAKQSASYSTTGSHGRSIGMSQMSAMPGHGTGVPTGQTVEGVEHSHPIGMNTGTQRPSAAHNSRVGGGGGGYGTGGAYT